MDRFTLSAAELYALSEISRDIRRAVRGLAVPGTSVANTVAARGHLRPHSSIRALIAMDDLRRPRRNTLDGLAAGIGLPDRADDWWALWSSIRHPVAS